MKPLLIVIVFLVTCQTLTAQEVMEMMAPQEMPSGVNVFEKDGLSGVMDYDNNTILIPAEYRGIDKVANGIYIVRQEYAGVYSTLLAKFLLPLEYQHISFIGTPTEEKFRLIVAKGNKYGLLDNNYQTVLNLEYDRIQSEGNYAIITKDRKAGIYFVDRTAKDVPVIYDEIHELYGTQCVAAKIGDLLTVFDLSGGKIIENVKHISRYDDRWIERSSGNILIVDQHGKNGIYNSKLNAFMLELVYDTITDGFQDHFVVEKNSMYGIVTNGDKVVIPFKYDSLAFMFPKSINTPILAARKNHFGLINIANKRIVDVQYDEIKNINGFYKAKKKGKYSVLDSLGHPITNLVFDDVGTVHYSINGSLPRLAEMAVFNDGKFGYMDVKGSITKTIKHPSMARGYKNLNALFEGFAKALKSENDSLILEFCRDVVFDAYSQELFLRIGYQYRGFPDKLLERYTIEDVVKEYYKGVHRFYQRLKDRGQLQTLTFIGFDRPGFGFFDRSRSLMGTEQWGIFKTQDRNSRVKLGELIEVDGYWKTFTDFRTN
jgi:hypothetical protein